MTQNLKNIALGLRMLFLDMTQQLLVIGYQMRKQAINIKQNPLQQEVSTVIYSTYFLLDSILIIS